MGRIRKVASLGRVSIARAEDNGLVLLFRQQVGGLERGPLARRPGILILESIWEGGGGEGDEMGERVLPLSMARRSANESRGKGTDTRVNAVHLSVYNV